MNSEKFKYLLNLVLKNIKKRKLRSILTIISVTIGIASIIALILISDGLFNSVEKQFMDMGINNIYVTPVNFGGGANGEFGSSSRLSDDIKLTERDVKDIERLAEINQVFGISYKIGKITVSNQDEYAFVIMADRKKADDIFETMNLEIQKGTSLQGKNGHVAIIGSYFADGLFEKEVKIGSKIKIEDVDFKVIGILETIGNTQDDSQIYIPKDAGEDIFGTNDELQQIMITIKDGYDVDEVKEKIQNKLEKTHEENTFTVITAKQILSLIKNILNSLQILLITIAAISVIVGSVGIMNSIYTSVIERTKEVGILKSIGAKINDILFIFVSESIILSIIGGLIGLIFGIGIAKAVELYAAYRNFDMLHIIVNPEIIIITLILSIIIGLIAGVLPARKASKMNAVDALKNIN